MSEWVIKDGMKTYCGGQQDYREAAALAEACKSFVEDYEEELMADEKISCYNCRYRRWTANSFQCLKQPSKEII